MQALSQVNSHCPYFSIRKDEGRECLAGAFVGKCETCTRLVLPTQTNQDKFVSNPHGLYRLTMLSLERVLSTLQLCKATSTCIRGCFLFSLDFAPDFGQIRLL
jgi:hypothetical protein